MWWKKIFSKEAMGKRYKEWKDFAVVQQFNQLFENYWIFFAVKLKKVVIKWQFKFSLPYNQKISIHVIFKNENYFYSSHSVFLSVFPTKIFHGLSFFLFSFSPTSNKFWLNRGVFETFSKTCDQLWENFQ